MEDSKLMEARHKQEKKDLIAQTQKMKHSIPPNDKKKRKECMAQIEAMMSELQLKHKAECDAFSIAEPETSTDLLNGNIEEDASVDFQTKESKKPGKSKRRKEKKEKERLERDRAIAEQSFIDATSGPKFEEDQKFIERLGLNAIHEIRPDGNCMFSAISHQLALRSDRPTQSIDALRSLTAAHLRSNREQFASFFLADGAAETEQSGFDERCDEILKDGVWGGELELIALSECLPARIDVIQADGPVLTFGERHGDTLRLRISYHRHAYGMGEHYNSVL